MPWIFGTDFELDYLEATHHQRVLAEAQIVLVTAAGLL